MIIIKIFFSICINLVFILKIMIKIYVQPRINLFLIYIYICIHYNLIFNYYACIHNIFF